MKSTFTLTKQHRMGWLATMLGSLLALSAMAAPGRLDTTFGSGGKVIADFPGITEQSFAMAIQPDGKIVVAGMYFSGANTDFTVLRYNPNGSPDTTFSGDGKASVDFGGTNDQANAVAIQPDGKIVVAGFSTAGLTSSIAVARFTTTGALDTTFDGDGKLTAAVGEDSSSANSVILQADNKILVAGWSMIAGDYEFTVLRYTPTGALDTTFDTDGIVTVSFGLNNSYATKVLVNPGNQNIIVVGSAYSGIKISFATVRLTPAGALDNTFGFAGRVLTSIGTWTDSAEDAVLQTDGKLVVAGSSDQGGYADFALARYNINGSLDTTFSTDGKLTLPFGSGPDYGSAVAIQADGKFIIGGSTFSGGFNQFALARYTTTGDLDPTFGTAGKTSVSVGAGHDNISALAIQTDGNIVATGDAYNSSGEPEIGVARFSVKQADVRLGTTTSATVGNNIYNTTGTDQELTAPVARSGGVRTRYALIQNDGPQNESFFVRGTAGNTDFRVRYLNGASDITTSVVAGTYRTGALTPQGTKLLTVEITAKTAAAGRTLNVRITATPVTDSTGADRANLRVSSTP